MLDARHPGERLEGGTQIVRCNLTLGVPDFVQHHLHPQLGGLMDHDEKYLVVLSTDRMLLREQGFEREVVGVGVIGHR